MSRKILIVEDEEKIARFVELELVHEGYEVIKAFDGRTGLDLALSEHADLAGCYASKAKWSGGSSPYS